jgi:hypothetical protein
MRSELPAELIEAYRATDYRVGPGSGAMILRIDQYCAALAELYRASNRRCAAFVSAFNPASKPASLQANLEAHALLRAAMDRSKQCAALTEGEAVDRSGAWPAEASWFGLGIERRVAIALGREFGQNAIVWAGADAIPRLVLLR